MGGQTPASPASCRSRSAPVQSSMSSSQSSSSSKVPLVVLSVADARFSWPGAGRPPACGVCSAGDARRLGEQIVHESLVTTLGRATPTRHWTKVPCTFVFDGDVVCMKWTDRCAQLVNGRRDHPSTSATAPRASSSLGRCRCHSPAYMAGRWALVSLWLRVTIVFRDRIGLP